MKKLLLLTLSLSAVLQLTAGNSTNISAEEHEALMQRTAASKQRTAASKQRRDELKSAGLSLSNSGPTIASVVSCDNDKSLKAVSLVPGFVVSFCSGSTDMTKVDRKALLTRLQKDIQNELEQEAKAA